MASEFLVKSLQQNQFIEQIGVWFDFPFVDLAISSARTKRYICACDRSAGTSAAQGWLPEETPMAVDIVATKNGPYLITGDLSLLELRDGDGNLYDVQGKSRVFLCRCGASITKPFCDGQHSKIGFQAAEAAVNSGG